MKKSVCPMINFQLTPKRGHVHSNSNSLFWSIHSCTRLNFLSAWDANVIRFFFFFSFFGCFLKCFWCVFVRVRNMIPKNSSVQIEYFSFFLYLRKTYKYVHCFGIDLVCFLFVHIFIAFTSGGKKPFDFSIFDRKEFIRVEPYCAYLRKKRRKHWEFVKIFHLVIRLLKFYV